MSIILENFATCSNLTLSTHYQRCYPYGCCASHILGYLNVASKDNYYGITGVEKVCEDSLRGKEGLRECIVNSFGKRIDEKEIELPLRGSTVQTTLDLAYQRRLERLFEGVSAGAGIIMSPQTGDIYALVSAPSFDPHLFLHPISPEQWQELNTSKTFLNRALYACYPPASTFKLITTTAALETNAIDPNHTTYCHGYLTFGPRDYNCMNHEGHGCVTLTQAIARSCNIPFFELAAHKKISIDTIAHYAHLLGLGQTSGILLPEKKGVVPSRAWKKAVLHQSWWPGETLSAAIGQGYLLVTPMQMARVVGGIFEGYLVRPRLFLSESIDKTPLPLQAGTRSFIKEAMRQTVVDGTGRALAHIHQVKLYAKSGTAQTVSRVQKVYTDDSEKEHAWFLTYIKPPQGQPLVMAILVEHAGSAAPARTIVKRFIEETFCGRSQEALQ